MNYINTEKEMTSILQKYLEVVLCGYSAQSKAIIDFYKKRGLLRQISCIATENAYNSNVMEEYEDKAVFFLEDTRIFWQTAAFFICDDNEKHIEWINRLKKCKCKNVFIIKQSVYKEIKSVLGKDFSWKLDQIRAEINNLKFRVAEQDEVCALHHETFGEYENCFNDRDVVIVGAGPSTQYYKPIPNAIHIALNQAWRKADTDFDFLFTQDAATTRRDKVVEGLDKIKKTVFMGRYLRRFYGNWMEFAEKYYGQRNNIKQYFTDPSEGGACIYKNVLFHPLRDYYSVAFPALHFALFTHPKRIFLVGLDTNSGHVSHFYDSCDISYVVSGVLKAGYIKFKKFASHKYPDVEILSINPVGLRGLFQDIYTDNNPDQGHIRQLVPELSMRIPKNSRIALYGAGDQGKRFYEILRNSENISICNWVDMDYDRIGFPVNNPESLRELNRDDYVLIAIEREDVVQKVKQYLIEIGISQERIIWFPDTPRCG